MLKGHFPLRDGEGGSFAVDSARVDHPSLRRLRQQDSVLIEQALAGDGDGIENGEEQGHHQKDKQDDFLIGGQRTDSLHFYLLRKIRFSTRQTATAIAVAIPESWMLRYQGADITV